MREVPLTKTQPPRVSDPTSNKPLPTPSLPYLLQHELAVRREEKYGKRSVQHAGVDVSHQVRYRKGGGRDDMCTSEQA